MNIHPRISKLTKHLQQLTPSNSRAALIASIVAIATIGTGLVFMTHAATPTSSFEAEDGSVTGSAQIVQDATASNGGTLKSGSGAGNSAGGRTVNVSDSDGLTAAIADARPGDTIHLADGQYTGSQLVTTYGNFTGSFAMTSANSGTASAPITLTGSANAVIDGHGTGGHYALYLAGTNYWNISGITIGGNVGTKPGASKGIVLDGSNHITLDGIHVYNIGSEGVHFRSFSSDNIIKNSVVEQTGVTQAQFGEGVYIGSANSNWPVNSGGNPDASDRNKVLNNTIGNTGAENIDIKEGSTGGLVDGNHFDGVHIQNENSGDSWIDVKGNNYTISNNTGVVSSGDNTLFHNGFELHQAVVGWGINNVFHGNTMNLANAIIDPAHTATTGFGFYQQKNLTGNILSCDNTVLSAPQGFGVYNVLPQACNNQ